MKSSAAVVLGVSFVAVATLAGCSPTPDTTPETFVSGPAEPAAAPTATANPIEPDATLIVRATAVAGNGAALSLEMQVHSSVGWDDIANQTLPAAMAEDCAADLNATRFETEQWSFTRVNVSAIPTTTSSADWPESSPVWVGPSADFVNIVGRGTLAAEAGAESPCATDKFVPGVGNGAFAIGIPGDAQGPNSGEFTRWAAHRFGFILTDPDSGITLTGCSFELTPLGESLLGDAGVWASTSSDESCTTGAANEATDR